MTYNIVIVDPALKKVGHHISFNKHVIRLFSKCGFNTTFLDYNSILDDSSQNVNYKKISLPTIDTDHKANNLESQLAISPENYKSFWNQIEILNPDIVFFTSEATLKRESLYCTSPISLRPRLFIVVHVIWSFLKSIQTSQKLNKTITQEIGGIFVLEEFLTKKLIQDGYSRIFWFPHRSYEDNIIIPKRPNMADKLRINTTGVINERRNNAWLINALNNYKNDPIEYTVAGQLYDSVREEVTSSIASTNKNSNLTILSNFSYLKDSKIQEIITTSNVGLLGYSADRNLQASGAIYTYFENGCPVIAPDSWLFKNYKSKFPDFIYLYEQKNVASLHHTLYSFKQLLNNKHYNINFSELKSMCSINDHCSYLISLFNFLSGSEKLLTRSFYSSNLSLNSSSNKLAQLCLAGAYPSLKSFKLEEDIRKIQSSVNQEHLLKSNINKKSTNGIEKYLNPDYFSDNKKINILVGPNFKDAQLLVDSIARLEWHLKPIFLYVKNIYVLLEENISGDVCSWLSPSSFLMTSNSPYHKQFIDKITLASSSMSAEIANNIDIVYNFDISNNEWGNISIDKLKNLNIKVWNVDEQKVRFASSFLLKSVSENLLETSTLQEDMKSRFNLLKDSFCFKKTAIFGTGPSLESCKSFSFSEYNTIAINSMVKDIALLDHINPSVIVCADPIFHAGASTYANEFRSYLKKALIKYKVPLCVPLRDYHIYLDFLGELSVHLIAIPFKSISEINNNMLDNFYVSTTGNIITLFSLPIASSFTKEIAIFGCDGRPVSENNYFWKHNPSSQLNDHMESIQAAHPGFFKLDYNDYYSEHCRKLSSYIDQLELQGYKIVSRSFSHIECLKKREEL